MTVMMLSLVYTNKYILFIKSMTCLACGGTPVDPDHLEAVGMGNCRGKPSFRDLSCVPLCRKCHTERHSLGISDFEKKKNVNLWRWAFKLLRKHYLE